jgi:hypothetical protein
MSGPFSLERPRISSATLVLPNGFRENQNALMVTHDHFGGENTYSLAIANGEMWINGDIESLTSLVDSLIYRLNTLAK